MDGFARDYQDVHDDYVSRYRADHRPPVPRAVVQSDYPFGLFMFFLFSMAVFGAFRTGSAIYDIGVKEQWSPFFSGLMAILGVVSVEGFIVSHAIYRERTYVNTRPWLEWMSILIGLLITVTAGSKVSMAIIESLSSNSWRIGVEWVLAALLGVGAGLSMWGYGEFIGNKRFAERFKTIEAEQVYQQELEAYEQALEQAWMESDERRLAIQDTILESDRLKLERDLIGQEAEEKARLLRTKARLERNKLRGNGTFRSDGGTRSGTEEYVPERSAEQKVEQHQQSISEYVVAWLEDESAKSGWRGPEDVPSTREIMRMTGVQQPSSTDRGRRRWLRNRSW